MRVPGRIGLLFVFVSGCFTSIRTSFPDSGDGGGLDTDAGGLGVDGGADSIASPIAITRPASPAYTNQAIAIEVSVGAGGGSSLVQLLNDGVLLTTWNAPPYTFIWDTTQVAEGSHQLVAQAVVAGQIVASSPVTIVVDRSPPTIVSRNPSPGADNVSLTDPIRVVFSEAIAPTSVKADAVRLALGSRAVDSTSTLGPDGKTISVAITDRSSLALPGTMTETIAASITDLAGNSFAGTSWGFAVPLWVDLGSVPVGNPSIAVDPAGAPVVMTNSGTFHIARYLGGTSWDTSIPSPQTAGTTVAGAFTIGSGGEIWVAWTESSSMPVHVARWTGTTWDRSYGTLLTLATASAAGANIALTSTGHPVVRWVEPVNMGRGPGYVSRWNGSSWTPYAGAPGDYSGPVLLDGSDLPITTAGNQMTRWTGSAWTSPQGMGVYGLAINSTDDGIGLQLTSDGTIQPLALSKAGVLSNYVPGLAGEPVQEISFWGIAIGKLDEPVITWFSFVGGTAPSYAQVHVARWTGARWDQGYGVLPNSSGTSALTLAGGAIPIVAWNEYLGTTTHVSKSNH